jgi:hypothetical protein
MSPQQQAVVQAVHFAGEKGISRDALALVVNVGIKTLNKHAGRARKAGGAVFMSYHKEGGKYFARPEWAAAADAVYAAQVKAAREARAKLHDAVRKAKQKAKRAAEREARKLMPKAPRRPRTIKPREQTIVVRQARQPLNHPPVVVHQPRVTSETKVTIAPAFVDRRWLPDVVRPVVNPAECRPWAVAAIEKRAA